MTASIIAKTNSLLRDYENDWAICGGWAIDLFLGKVTREHKDVDLFIWRKDQLYTQQFFMQRGWQLRVASDGRLSNWEKGNYLELPVHCIWCRHENYEPGFIELLLNERDERQFIYRRNTQIQLSIENVILKSESEIPYLAPELVLLYKSKHLNNEDSQHDFEICFPKLGENQRKWLLDSLRTLYSDEHLWLKQKGEI